MWRQVAAPAPCDGPFTECKDGRRGTGRRRRGATRCRTTLADRPGDDGIQAIIVRKRAIEGSGAAPASVRRHGLAQTWRPTDLFTRANDGRPVSAEVGRCRGRAPQEPHVRSRRGRTRWWAKPGRRGVRERAEPVAGRQGDGAVTDHWSAAPEGGDGGPAVRSPIARRPGERPAGQYGAAPQPRCGTAQAPPPHRRPAPPSGPGDRERRAPALRRAASRAPRGEDAAIRHASVYPGFTANIRRRALDPPSFFFRADPHFLRYRPRWFRRVPRGASATDHRSPVRQEPAVSTYHGTASRPP